MKKSVRLSNRQTNTNRQTKRTTDTEIKAYRQAERKTNTDRQENATQIEGETQKAHTKCSRRSRKIRNNLSNKKQDTGR